MDITIGGIGIPTCDFTPSRGESHASFFGMSSTIGAMESIHALLAGMEFKGEGGTSR